jgi:hypothetical protein
MCFSLGLTAVETVVETSPEVTPEETADPDVAVEKELAVGKATCALVAKYIANS